MREFDPSQYGEADRREVNPSIEVDGPLRVSWIGGSKNAENGLDAYAGQTDVNGGSRLLIFVWRTDNSFDVLLALNAD